MTDRDHNASESIIAVKYPAATSSIRLRHYSPRTEKPELASEIIKRSLRLDLPELSDETLLLAADQTFLQLDKEESIHE